METRGNVCDGGCRPCGTGKKSRGFGGSVGNLGEFTVEKTYWREPVSQRE